MKVAVTGASGFVGAATCRALLARGHGVRALLRAGRSDDALGPLGLPGVELVHADLADPNTLRDAAHGCDALVHCAGESARHATPAASAWINVAGTENALQGARHAGVRRFVHLSCADVSLCNRDRVHWKENAVLGQEPLGAFARNKLLAEELVLQAGNRKLSVVAVRPAYLWGPGEHTNAPELCRQARLGGVRLFSSGDNLFSSAHVDNVARLLALAAESERADGQAVHVADPDFLTSREFFTSLCGALGLPPPRRGLYAVEYAAAWVRQMRRAEGPWPDDVARVGRGAMLDCLRALSGFELEGALTVADGMTALAAWSKQVGGPAAIERLARRPASAEQLAHHRALAADPS